jgi:hypothetical protein
MGTKGGHYGVGRDDKGGNPSSGEKMGLVWETGSHLRIFDDSSIIIRMDAWQYIYCLGATVIDAITECAGGFSDRVCLVRGGDSCVEGVEDS